MKLSALFTDHAVLQRDRSIPVWGWTTPRLRVRVAVDGRAAAETQAGMDGRFLVRLPPMPAGGPITLEVTTPDPAERAVVRDVLVGEVWVCSGQSNMEFALSACGDAGVREIARAAAPRLRTIKVPREASPARVSDVEASWQVCSPATAGVFTAVGYYFAQALQAALDVPVGLVNTSWGGTRIEAWTSRESMVEDPELQLEVEHWEASCNRPEFWASVPFDPAEAAAGPAPAVPGYPADPGNGGFPRGWAGLDFDDGAWPVMPLPGTWQTAGHGYSGVFWFRRTVDVPAAWAGRDLELGIGAVDKSEITYFNGEQVGATGRGFDEQCWNVPRFYRVPGRLVRAGRNVIAVRAYSFVFHGGMIGPVAAMRLAPAEGAEAPLALDGDWRYAVEHNLGTVQPFTPPPGPGSPHVPGILYDNMLAPLLPYGMRGVLWYQGESNAPTAYRYGRSLARMIRDWRHAWGQGDFPFLTVQLANYQPPQAYQADSTWALVREGQLQSLELPETGMAVITDIGEAGDIHPKNKWDVGRRLAQWALVQTYGRPGVPGGPLFAGATIERGGIRVRFRHAGGGLMVQGGGTLKTFVIAGANRKFLPAAALIQGDSVWVSSPDVPDPVAVRYAWADNPDGANLCTAEGGPASPFRTDRW